MFNILVKIVAKNSGLEIKNKTNKTLKLDILTSNTSQNIINLFCGCYNVVKHY